MQCVCGSSTCSSTSPRDLTAAFGVILFTKFAIQLLCFNEEEEVTATQQRLALKRRESCFDFDFVLDLIETSSTQDTEKRGRRWRDRRKSSAPDFTPYLFFFLGYVILIPSVYNFYFYFFF